MEMEKDRIYNLILDVARAEDGSLRNLREGIFFIPERGFAYLVGKALASNAQSVFGTNNVRWLPETKLGSKGPSDLVFEIPGQQGLVIEFKIRGTISNCVQDLEKLSELGPTAYRRFFCALIDPWPDSIGHDARIGAIEQWTGSDGSEAIPARSKFDFFTTLDRMYVNQICCLVGLWEVTKRAR